MSLSIYYDGDCPFCEKYTKWLRLKDSVADVTLCDLRENTKIRDELIEQGFELDKGMVVDFNGVRTSGDDAVNTLALLSSPVNAFNKINKFIMSSPLMAKALYPFLRAGRWLVLFFLGREQIQAESEGVKARAGIFGLFFALFSFFHFFNYALEYDRFPPQLDQLAILVCAVLLFYNPRSARLLCLLMLVSSISAIAQAPVGSNHTIVRNFTILGYWASFLFAMIKGRRWSDIFSNFTVAGQGSLFVMYFFGVFHKINTDFLNPETSCAVVLWRQMPKVLNWLDFSAMHYLAIYGTFIVEFGLVLMLFFSRTRHVAVVCGILFHLLLALSGYAMYISFTTLAIALHCLFLNSESALNIQNSNIMRAITERKKNPIYILTAIILVMMLFSVGVAGDYSMVTILMLPVLLPFCYVVMRHGRSTKSLLGREHRLSANIIGGGVAVLFFANCFMPYFGLKTAQTVNMFANLRLEAGSSNHLIMSSAPGPFKYLEDVVFIKDINGEAEEKFSSGQQQGFIYYNILAELSDNPDLVISYQRGGQIYNDMTAETLKDDVKNILHPPWFRKWFHFKQAAMTSTDLCRY